MVTTEFIDLTGSAPGWSDGATAVPGTWLAVYVTGSGPVPESAAELAAARAAGVNLITIDQQPGLPLFRLGQADVADVEAAAASAQDFADAVAERRASDIQNHTGYASFDVWTELFNDVGGDQTGVWYWVADYAWSANQSIQLLAAHADWGGTQFGDPESNPYTYCPGTSITLPQASADIDMGNDAWLALFTVPVPTPPPPPPATFPAYPLPATDDYCGTSRPDPHCFSGYYGDPGHAAVLAVQQRLKDRGWTITVDGEYGDEFGPRNQGQTPAVVHAFQAQKGLTADYLAGYETWKALWEDPITPG